MGCHRRLLVLSLLIILFLHTSQHVSELGNGDIAATEQDIACDCRAGCRHPEPAVTLELNLVGGWGLLGSVLFGPLRGRVQAATPDTQQENEERGRSPGKSVVPHLSCKQAC